MLGKIYNPIWCSCELGKLNRILLKYGEDGKLGKGGHMENHEHTPKFELASDFVEFARTFLVC